MVEPQSIPGWKRREYSDLVAGVMDYRDIEPLLAADAERAWDEGYPISVVLHAASRAWAQNSPGNFRVILHNHAEDALTKLSRLSLMKVAETERQASEEGLGGGAAGLGEIH